MAFGRQDYKNISNEQPSVTKFVTNSAPRPARIHENGDGKENKINVAGEWGAYEMVGKDWGNVSGGISS